MIRSALLLALLLALLWPRAAVAEDWPCFRGPTRQGISSETGLPTKWSATENVAWKTPIPGQGWSSPIVFGERVFVTTATDNAAICRVLCLDRRSGKVLWDKQILEQVIKRKESKNSGATPTPVTDGKLVYAAFCDGSLVALDFDGNVAWTNREHKFYSQHGLGVSPILFGDLLIMPRDASSEGPDKTVGWKKPWDQAVILALDKKTGQVKWQGKRGMSRIAHVTPTIMDVAGKPMLVSAAGDVIQGHDPADGRLIWTAKATGEGVVPSVVVGDGLVFASSGFEQSTIRAVKPDGQGEVTATHIVWEQKTAAPTQPSFAYLNGLLFTIKESGIAMCLDAKTGAMRWQERIGGNHCASPIAAEGRLYFLSEEGETAIIEAGPQFKVLERNKVGEKCQASIAVSQKQLFIRTETNLYCIGTGR